MSPATGKRYPLTLICAVWRIARSSVYACQQPAPVGASMRQPCKRGPQTALSDAELVEQIRSVLKEECIYLHHFRTLEEARFTIGRFIQQYNSEWLLQRHGYMTPAEVRQQLTRTAA